MAKGRKIRWLGESADYNPAQGTGTDVSEFGEEDVWSMVDGAVDRDDHMRQGASADWCSAGAESNLDAAAAVMRNQRLVGGLSQAFDDKGRSGAARIVHQFHSQDSRHVATSAPVNVPSWTRIPRVESVESMHEWDDDTESHDLERVPPHEYLAREYARSHKMVATSVFEGVGRTLKGRDMSRVRDAVWSRTGFNG